MMIIYQILLLIIIVLFSIFVIAERDKTYKKMYAMVNVAAIVSFMIMVLFG